MAETIFSVLLSIISIVWIAQGVELGIWIPGVSAGSGFIPTVFAALTLGSSLFVLYSGWKKRKAFAQQSVMETVDMPENGDKPKLSIEKLKSLIPVAFCVGAIVSLQLFGLVITVFAISFLWMRFVSRYPMKKSLLVAVLLTLFIYLVFEFWLKIPFPGDIIKL